MATIVNKSVDISKPVKRKPARKPPPQLVLFVLAYRLEVIRYWCTVCLSPTRDIEVSNSNIIMAVMEFELTLKWMSGVSGTQLRKHLQAAEFCRPLGAACDRKGPRVAQCESFAAAVLVELGQIEAELDRALAGRAGWEWYCLGRAIGDYRIQLYKHLRDVGTNGTFPQPSGIARAALAIPRSEAQVIPTIDRLRGMTGSWAFDRLFGPEHQDDVHSVTRQQQDLLYMVEGWQARLNRELCQAFSEAPIAASAPNQFAFGFLGLRFDDIRRIAYRDVNGREVHSDLSHDARLWLFLKELSRAKGDPLDKEAFCKTRSSSGYADDIEDGTFRKDKYRLSVQLSPLKLKIMGAGKLAYVLAEAEDRKR